MSVVTWDRQGFASANEIPVKITTVYKLTTSNYKLCEGDSVEFVFLEDVKLNSSEIIKIEQKVNGTVTSREENGFLWLVANIYIEYFYRIDSTGKRQKLNGVIYKKGTNHDVITGFFELFMIPIRGGEAEIIPIKDNFIIHAECK